MSHLYISWVPTDGQPRYKGKVAVLIGPKVLSSCEAFVLMMKQVPGCTVFGSATGGSSGNPKPIELGNSVTVYLPSWKAQRPNGTDFEGEGISPDIVVKTTRMQLRSGDPVIVAALRHLRGR